MGLDIFDRQLRLMILLTQNQSYTLDEIMKRLDMSKRTIYRYVEEFRDFGFIVKKENGRVRLDKSSPFFKQITEKVHFTEPEAILLKKVLEGIPHKSVGEKQLLLKLSRLYDLQLLEEVQTDENYVRNQQALYQAAKEGRQVVLKDYRSSNSNSTSSRLVEPFAFLANNTEVRCFEIASQMNKTFKIQRIGEVVLMPTTWDFRKQHRQVYTDSFHFSSEELIPVRLRLDLRAANCLQEEFVVNQGELEPIDDNHWLYSTKVCSYIGIGRFIMGLPNSVEILEDEGLRNYVLEEVKKAYHL